MSTDSPLDIGDGVYTLPAAMRILMRSGLQRSPRRLKRWAQGGLTYGTHATAGVDVLSFMDLVSLEVVACLRHAGLSSQGVHELERRLGERLPDWDYPLARGIFFTEGEHVWAVIPDEPDGTIEIIGDRRNAYVMRPIVRPLVQEVRFSDDEQRRAIRWALNEWVEMDPAIQFGAPVVKGTRTTVSTIAANLRVGRPEEVADWYGLSVEQILGVQDYLSSVA